MFVWIAGLEMWTTTNEQGHGCKPWSSWLLSRDAVPVLIGPKKMELFKKKTHFSDQIIFGYNPNWDLCLNLSETCISVVVNDLVRHIVYMYRFGLIYHIKTCHLIVTSARPTLFVFALLLSILATGLHYYTWITLEA